MTAHCQIVGGSVRIRMSGRVQQVEVKLGNGHWGRNQNDGYMKSDFTKERQSLRTKKAYKKLYREYRYLVVDGERRRLASK